MGSEKLIYQRTCQRPLPWICEKIATIWTQVATLCTAHGYFLTEIVTPSTKNAHCWSARAKPQKCAPKRHYSTSAVFTHILTFPKPVKLFNPPLFQPNVEDGRKGPGSSAHVAPAVVASAPPIHDIPMRDLPPAYEDIDNEQNQPLSPVRHQPQPSPSYTESEYQPVHLMQYWWWVLDIQSLRFK